MATSKSSSSVRWFYATDIPKRDERPFSVKIDLAGKKPTAWTSFSDLESAYLESEYNKWLKKESKGQVAVLEDKLFQVDVTKRELSSIYWTGLVYEVRRGTWFTLEGSKYIPCDENLASQVEDGYLKFHPWAIVPTNVNSSGTNVAASIPTSYSMTTTNKFTDTNSMEIIPFLAITTSSSKQPSQPIDNLSAINFMNKPSETYTYSTTTETKPELKWELFGPYVNQYVIYANATTAFLLNDMITAKLARAILAAFTNGENLGGVKLIRGWSEVEKLQQGVNNSSSSSPTRLSGKPNLTATSSTSTTTNNSPSKNLGGSGTKSMNEKDNLPKGIVSNISTTTVTSSSTRSLSIRQNDAEEQDKTMKPSDLINDNLSESGSTSGISLDEIPCPDEYEGNRKIEHLVLVVHGIGQKLGEKTEAVNFVHDCNVLRKLMKENATQLYNSFKEGEDKFGIPEGGGIQVLPIHWRHDIGFDKSDSNTDSLSKDNKSSPSSLTGKPENKQEGHYEPHDQSDYDDPEKKEQNINEEHVNLDEITLEGVPSIRTLVSDVVMDVLLYMTPKYRQQMIKKVTNELNRIYHEFKTRHPEFNGKVHIFGHSLGSLLSFDILSHQQGPFSDAESVESLYYTSPIPSTTTEVDLSEAFQNLFFSPAKQNQNSNYINSSSINEKKDPETTKKKNVEKIELGHKIRGFDPDRNLQEEPSIMAPKVNGLYNIFHPHDPVAYRIEPLIQKQYSQLKPIHIPYTKGGLTGTLVGIQDLSNDLVDKGLSMFESVKSGFISTTTGVVTSATKMVERIRTISGTETDPSKLPSNSNSSNLIDLNNSSSILNNNNSSSQDPQQTQKKDIEILNPRKRVDFAIQEGVLENSYLSALGVHMNYWSEPDSTMFMIKEMYMFPVPKEFLRAQNLNLVEPIAHVTNKIAQKNQQLQQNNHHHHHLQFSSAAYKDSNLASGTTTSSLFGVGKLKTGQSSQFTSPKK